MTYRFKFLRISLNLIFGDNKLIKERFAWKEFIGRIMVIAIPVALQNLLTTTGSMVDTMMIAALGENSVAAVGLCAQYATLIFSCYWGFVGGGMLFFSQYWGAGDEKGICRTYGTTLTFMMAVAAIVTTLAAFRPDFIMRVYTDKPAIQEIGVEYLKAVFPSYPFQIFSMAMSAMLRTTDRVKIPLIGSIVSVFSNILLNWLLIGGNLGFPALGVKGAAVATASAAVINSLTIIVICIIKKYPFLFRFREHFDWSGTWVREYLKKSFPIICNELFIGIGFMVINMVLGRQPEEAIAALAVFRTLEGLVIAFFSGFSNAASILVGNCVGSGEIRTAYERAKRLVFLCGSVIAVVCIGIFVLHSPILRIMHLSGESFRICTQMIGVYSVAAVIRMCNWTQNDTYRSAGDTKFGTILEIAFQYGMVLPCIILAGQVFHLPTVIVFAAAYIDEPIRLVLMQIHMYSGKWIRPVTPEGRQALPGFMEEKRKQKVKEETNE